VQTPGTRRRAKGEGPEGPREIGDSSVEIITLVERGERMGTAMVSTFLASFHSMVILLFIYLFLSSLPSRPFLRTHL
jgi:hypothetical protein